MAMIQVGIAPHSIQAVACVSRVNSDLNAFLVFLPSTEPGPEESPKVRPQRPKSTGLDRWVVIICHQFSRWFELITFCAYCYMATKNGVYNKSRGD